MLDINRFQHNINLWAAVFSRICAGGSSYGGLKAGRMLYRAGVRAVNAIIVFHYILAIRLSPLDACRNLLRPHKHNKFHACSNDEKLSKAGNMPGKWQFLIFLGQRFRTCRKTAAPQERSRCQ